MMTDTLHATRLADHVTSLPPLPEAMIEVMRALGEVEFANGIAAVAAA
jgi:hypothetical protein